MEVTRPALSLDGVEFGYPGGPLVLRGVSLQIDPGQGVALFGPNGAGKTTLTRLAMALLHPARGTVITAGMDTEGRRPEEFASRAGYLFQHPEAQLFARNVRNELAFGPRQLGWTPDRVAERVGELLDQLGLAHVALEHPYDLSTPLRRMVALGTALAASPALLLLDEPTAGLDRASRRVVCRVVDAFRHAGGAVLAVTHDMEFAADTLERGIILVNGGIAADERIPDALAIGRTIGLAPPGPVEVIVNIGLTVPDWRRETLARALSGHCLTTGH